MAQAAGYNFNSDTVSGSIVRDLAGYFLDGTIVDSAAIVTGKTDYGNALNCTGGALRILVAADTYPVNNEGGITVAAWVKLNTTTAAARCIASGRSSSNLDWALYASNAAGNVEFVIEGVAHSSSTSIRDGAWHHVMAIVNRVNGPGNETVRIVVDGTLVLSATSLTTGFGYAGPVTIEVGRNALSGAQALDGIVDDFRWWNDPVGSASYAPIRDTEQEDLQYAVYPFDNGTGDDYGTHNHDLTLAGSSSFAAGLYGNALVSAAAAAGASAAVDFGDLDRLAVTGWIRLDVAPVGSAAPIMAITDTAGSTNKFRAVVNTDRTVTCTWITIYGTFSVTSTTTLTVGQWTRFHFNMNPTYVGIRLGSNSQVTTSTGNGDPHLTPTVNDLHTLYLGGDNAAGGQVSFDYVTCTRNFLSDPLTRYWSGPPSAAPYRPANVARGIWNFNENTGTAAADGSASDNDLTLTAAGSWVTGVQGSALGANGTGAGASDTSLAWPATPIGWSYSGWVKCRASSSGARFLVMRNGSQEVAHSGILDGRLWARLYGPGASTPGLINPTGAPIPSETWTHVAVSYDGVALSFYLNGKWVTSVDYAPGALQQPTALYVGGDSTDGSVADVDDLVMFDTPMSLANTTWLFQNPGAFATPPQDVTLPVAHETDTAHAVSPSKAPALAAAHEVDTAYPVTGEKAVTFPTVSETDTAHEVVASKAPGFDAVHEVDTAHPLGAAKTTTLAAASEAETAHQVIVEKTVTLATAHEVDTAHVVEIDNLGAARVLDTAHETDTAHTVTATKTVVLATAHEIDRAFALLIEGSGPEWPVLNVSNSLSSRLEVSHGI